MTPASGGAICAESPRRQMPILGKTDPMLLHRAALAVLIPMSFTACESGPMPSAASSPARVVEEMFAAMNAWDFDRACDLMTEDYRAEARDAGGCVRELEQAAIVVSQTEGIPVGEPYLQFAVGEVVEVDGDVAAVEVRLDPGSTTIQEVVRTAGRWLYNGPADRG